MLCDKCSISLIMKQYVLIVLIALWLNMIKEVIPRFLNFNGEFRY